jgi:Yip1 domain
MNLVSLAMLPLSTEQGWPELARLRPALVKVFALLVLPLALLPPVLLYYAGTHHPEMLPPASRARDWLTVASVFFVAEILTVLAMGWLIKQVAATYAMSVDHHDAYLLAAIAPVPMWLSSLALLVPSLAFSAAIGVTALGLSCMILYRGIQALGRRREEVVAATVVQIVIGAGITAWALLLALAFV